MVRIQIWRLHIKIPWPAPPRVSGNYRRLLGVHSYDMYIILSKSHTLQSLSPVLTPMYLIFNTNPNIRGLWKEMFSVRKGIVNIARDDLFAHVQGSLFCCVLSRSSSLPLCLCLSVSFVFLFFGLQGTLAVCLFLSLSLST